MIKTNRNFRMFVPTTIVFGPGELNRLHEQALSGKKALNALSEKEKPVRERKVEEALSVTYSGRNTLRSEIQEWLTKHNLLNN